MLGQDHREQGELCWIPAYLCASPSSWKSLHSTRSIINKPEEQVLLWSWIPLELRITSIVPGLLEAVEEKLKKSILGISLFVLILCHVTLFGASEGWFSHLDLRGYLSPLSFMCDAWKVVNSKSFMINSLNSEFPFLWGLQQMKILCHKEIKPSLCS